MKIVTFSFDDGVVQDRILAEMFNRYGMKATFNLCSAEWGQIHTIDHLGTVVDHSELPAEEIRNVYRGHEIAAHTKHHPSNLDELPAEQMQNEIKSNCEELEHLLCTKIVGLAYPWGKWNHAIISYLKDHTDIRYARTAKASESFAPPEDWYAWAPTFRATDPALAEKVERFLQEPDNGVKLMMIMGHAFEFDKIPLGWFNFEQVLRNLSAHENELLFCTNAEAQMLLNS